MRQGEFDQHVGTSSELKATLERLEAWVSTLPMESQVCGREHVCS